LEAGGGHGKLNAMKESLHSTLLFISFGLLAAFALQPRLDAGMAIFALLLALAAGVVWGTAAPSRSLFAPPLAASLLCAAGLAAAAWFLQPPVSTTAVLLALVLFIGRHPFLPLPERPAFTLLADLVSGFLLGLLASARPGQLPAQLGAGHLALAYGGLLLYAEGAGRRWVFGHGCWLAFYLLGVGMVGLKFYPLMAFLPFFLGSGTALYFFLTRQEPNRRAMRTYAGVLLLLGAILLIDRVVRP
jgi:hypothetical protein